MFIKLTPRAPIQIIPAGTETDPTGFTDEMTVAGTTGKVTKTGIDGEYIFWYAVSLVADIEYTFVQVVVGGSWDIETAAMYLYDSTPAVVVETTFDWDLWIGGNSMTYTPSVTGVYLLKVMGLVYETGHETSITPVPATYALEQTGNRTAKGFDRFGRFIEYSSSIDAELLSIATSYDNPGGKGDRTAMITTSSSFGGLNTSVLVNGSLNNATEIGGNYDCLGQYIEFEFPTARCIQEVTLYWSSAQLQGTWKIQAYNGETWVDLGDAMELGNPNLKTYVMDTPANNTKFYKRYRWTGVSGTIGSVAYFLEIEFKIDAGVY